MTSCGQLSLRIGTLGRVDDHGRVLPDDDEARSGKAAKRLCADIDGWSLHAAVTVHADDDVGRENLCRYILRHPISLQRLSMTRDGRVAYRVKYPRGNRTHLLMEPVQFLARLASLVPRLDTPWSGTTMCCRARRDGASTSCPNPTRPNRSSPSAASLGARRSTRRTRWRPLVNGARPLPTIPRCNACESPELPQYLVSAWTPLSGGSSVALVSGPAIAEWPATGGDPTTRALAVASDPSHIAALSTRQMWVQDAHGIGAWDGTAWSRVAAVTFGPTSPDYYPTLLPARGGRQSRTSDNPARPIDQRDRSRMHPCKRGFRGRFDNRGRPSVRDRLGEGNANSAKSGVDNARG